MQRGALTLALILGCSGGTSTDAKVAIELAEQPIIKDGIRSIFAIELGAMPQTERRAALERAVRTMRIRLQLAHVPGHVAVDGTESSSISRRSIPRRWSTRSIFCSAQAGSSFTRWSLEQRS